MADGVGIDARKAGSGEGDDHAALLSTLDSHDLATAVEPGDAEGLRLTRGRGGATRSPNRCSRGSSPR